MTFNNNNNTQRPAGKEDAPNKIKFSSVKLGETKQGSPTVGLYFKGDQLAKFVELASEMLAAGQDGGKLAVIVIRGERYDSGYAYFNPKEEPRHGDNANNGNKAFGQKTGSNNPPSYRKQGNGDFGNKSQARAFLQSKRLNDDKETGSGN